MSKNFSVDYVANLARLELSDEERASFATQMTQILGYFDTLAKVNIEGVEPLIHPFPLENVWTADEPAACFTPEEALMNAPAKRQNQIVVPKVVDDA